MKENGREWERMGKNGRERERVRENETRRDDALTLEIRDAFRSDITPIYINNYLSIST